MSIKLKILSLFFLIISVNNLFAQKRGQERIDFLQNELHKNSHDTIRVKLHNTIAWEYTSGDLNKAEIHTKEALQLAQKIGFAKEEAKSYGILGTIENMKGNYIKAIEYHTRHLEIEKKIKNEINQAVAYFNLGNVFRNLGNMAEALMSYQNAYKTFEKSDHKVGMANSQQGIGNVHYALREFDKALPYFEHSLQINRSANNLKGMLTNHINIGGIQNEMKDYKAALESYDKALKIADELEDKYNQSLIYSNIGLVYELNDNLDQALSFYHQSKELAEAVQANSRLNFAFYRIGIVYFHKKEPKEAKKWLNKALEISKKTGNLENLIDNYGALTSVDSMAGDFKSAYNNYYWYSNYKDSIYNDETTRKLTEAKLNYEFERTQDSIRLVNEKEIALRDATLEANRKQKWFYFAGLLGLAAIGGLLYNQSRLRKKKNRELDEANRIKTRFFSILNHDLRSPVSNLIHFLHLKKENPELLDEETKSRLEQKTTQGAENLLVTMEDLLLWSKGQMENFKPQPKKIAVEELFEDIKKHFSTEEKIGFVFENPDNIKLVSDENYLKTILRNLTSNAVKALQNTENPQIRWKAWEEKGKTVFSITDNGPGADSERFRALYDDKEVVGIKTGLGLHLIRDLAKAVNCKIEVDTVPGSGTTIRLML